MNPYNCTRPGNLFVGYEELRRELLEDLCSGKSFAVLGGRRCGKTSLLLQIEKDAKSRTPEGRKLLPAFIDMQSLGELTPAVLFKSMYDLVVKDIAAPRWTGSAPGEEYQEFLRLLDTARGQLDQFYGAAWTILFLVDELDAAVSRLPNDQFFQNLRNFLMVSRFNDHFRLVASGVKEMAELISSGSSPLNNLCHTYLRVLNADEVSQLIHCGFPEGLPTDAEGALREQTGGHPYLLQGLLEGLRKRSGQLTPQTVENRAAEWMREHKDFRRWLDGFGPAERVVYQMLAEAPNRTLSIQEIRSRLDAGFLEGREDAITVLSFHGIIDDSDPEHPRVGARMFRDWFMQNGEPGQRRDEENRDLLLSLLEETGKQPHELAPGTPPTKGIASTTLRPPTIADHQLPRASPIGSGSYGTVWLAKTLMGTFRAIKVVYRESFEEQTPFAREFNGIKMYEPVSRSHPGLVQILQVGLNDADGYFYYVMEAGDDEIRGQEIEPESYEPKNLSRELMKRGRLPVSECLELGLALADALGHLHQHELIHRDLKPSNIIFVKGVPKLADIGLVTEMRSGAGQATWIGTQGYMPPEGPGTASADIYSLGKILYEAATGLDRGKFPSLPTASVPSPDMEQFHSLNEIILKACENEHHERYQSAPELHAKLRELQSSTSEQRTKTPRRGFWNRFMPPNWGK